MTAFPNACLVCNEKYPKFWRLPPGDTHELRFESHTYFMKKQCVMILRFILVDGKVYDFCGCKLMGIITDPEHLKASLMSLVGLETIRVFNAAMVEEANKKL